MVCGSAMSAKINITASRSAVARGRLKDRLRMGLILYTTPHYRDFSLPRYEIPEHMTRFASAPRLF